MRPGDFDPTQPRIKQGARRVFSAPPPPACRGGRDATGSAVVRPGIDFTGETSLSGAPPPLCDAPVEWVMQHDLDHRQQRLLVAAQHLGFRV